MIEASLKELKRKNNLTEEDMAKRVREWSEEVPPNIGQPQRRASVSEEVFRNKILQALSKGDKTQFKSFSDITAGEPNEYIPRFFMEALTLATVYKIEIKNQEEADRLEMRLFDPNLEQKRKETLKNGDVDQKNGDPRDDEDENEEEEEEEGGGGGGEGNGEGDDDEDDKEDDEEEDEDEEDDDEEDDVQINGETAIEAKNEGEPKMDNTAATNGTDQQF